MTTNQWKKNFSAIFSHQDTIIKGKLAFETSETNWLNTSSPVIISVNFQSVFHEGINGTLKMHALISILKSEIKGKITILLNEKAHLNVIALKYHNDHQGVFNENLKEADAFIYRFKNFFESCNVTFWHIYIDHDPLYPFFKEQILKLYQNDSVFRSHLHTDAETIYTLESFEVSQKSLFIDKAIEDLLEQCVAYLVLANKGYRFQFDTENSFTAVDYVSHVLLEQNRKMFLIHVSLTIKRKTVLKTLSVIE